MALSENSFSLPTNIQFGSYELGKVWVNSQTFILPGLTLAPPQVNTRAGAVVGLAADTVDYDDLSVDVILDKDWSVWNTLYKYFLDGLNVEHGTFKKDKKFDLWIEFFDGSGKSQKKFNFYNCRLLSFGNIQTDIMDTEDTINTMNLTFLFDYMEDMDNTFNKQVCFRDRSQT